MSRTINALQRGELQRGLQAATKDAMRLTRDISGADSEPVKAAAGVLQKEWRRLLGTKGGGKPSAPGAPPRRQSGRLWRSIRQAVVRGVRRVGSSDFRTWMLEYGVDSPPKPARLFKNQKGKNKGRMTKPRKGHHMAPRPHARPALENAQQQMTEVLVAESQRAVVTAKIGGT